MERESRLYALKLGFSGSQEVLFDYLVEQGNAKNPLSTVESIMEVVNFYECVPENVQDHYERMDAREFYAIIQRLAIYWGNES